MGIDLFKTSEYRNYATALNPSATLSWEEEKVSPKVYSLDDKNEGEYVCTKEMEVKCTRDEEGTEIKSATTLGAAFFESASGNYLRVTNVLDVIPHSDVVLGVDEAGYRSLQQLGITFRTDQALTAKVINVMGEYRYKVMENQEQYGFRTTLFQEKENICQHAFGRLYALQIVEQAFGKNKSEIKLALTAYQICIQNKIDALCLKYPEESKVILHLSDPTTALRLLQRELGFSHTLHEKLVLNELIQLHEDWDRASLLNTKFSASTEDDFSPRQLKFSVESFVRETTHKIINNAKFTNERITIGNGESTFRGALEEKLAKATSLCTQFSFSQIRSIVPSHQGDYFSEKKNLAHQAEKTSTKKITVSSSMTLGNTQESLERFLFASSLVLNTNDIASFKENLTVTRSPGWRKVRAYLFGHSHKTSKIMKSFHAFVAETKCAQPVSLVRPRSIAVRITEDFSDVAGVFKNFFWRLGRGLVSTFSEEFYKLKTDVLVKKHEPQRDLPQEPINDVMQDLILQEGWERWSYSEFFSFYIKSVVKDPELVLKLTEENKKFLKIMGEKEPGHAPYALPPSLLESEENNDDFLATLIGGLETAYDTFDNIYEANPCTGLYATACYALSGLAAVNPELMKTILAKVHLSSLTSHFIGNAWVADLMSKEETVRFLTAGLYSFRMIYYINQIITQAGDSAAGELGRQMIYHLPKIILHMVAATTVGKVIGDDFLKKIPIVGSLASNLREDAESVTHAEEFASGFKTVVLAYHGLRSEPDQESLLIHLISIALRIALYPVRLALSLCNFIYGFFDQRHLENAAKPWQDLKKDLISCCLRAGDFLLRTVNLACRMVKRIFKMTSEALLNTVITVIKFAGMIFGVKPENNKISERLINFKVASFNFFGKLARSIKNRYRQSRNLIAVQMHKNAEKLSTKEIMQTLIALPAGSELSSSASPIVPRPLDMEADPCQGAQPKLSDQALDVRSENVRHNPF